MWPVRIVMRLRPKGGVARIAGMVVWACRNMVFRFQVESMELLVKLLVLLGWEGESKNVGDM